MACLDYNPFRQDCVAGLFCEQPAPDILSFAKSVPSFSDSLPRTVLADLQAGFGNEGICFMPKGYPLTPPAIGTKFSEWEVLSLPIPGNKAAKISRRVKCKCSCGRERVVGLSDLLAGDSTRCRACGDHTSVQRNVIIHGALRDGKATLEYQSWLGMVVRCGAGPGHRYYASYAARGVVVYPRWLGVGGFQRFLDYIGLRPSPRCYLARYPNPDGSYEPGNVRWATRGEPNKSTKRYQRLLRHATPTWLTKEHWEAINEVYLNRPLGYHVDHEIPIQGKNVCGLHVPWNLQHLPAKENILKGNKLIAQQRSIQDLADSKIVIDGGRVIVE